MGFHKDNTAITCRIWVSFAVALAIASVFQLKDMRVAVTQYKMFLKFPKQTQTSPLRLFCEHGPHQHLTLLPHPKHIMGHA